MHKQLNLASTTQNISLEKNVSLDDTECVDK